MADYYFATKEDPYDNGSNQVYKTKSSNPFDDVDDEHDLARGYSMSINHDISPKSSNLQPPKMLRRLSSLGKLSMSRLMSKSSKEGFVPLDA